MQPSKGGVAARMNLSSGKFPWARDLDADYGRAQNVMRLAIYAALIYEFDRPATFDEVKQLVLHELRQMHPTRFCSGMTGSPEHFACAWIRLICSGVLV